MVKENPFYFIYGDIIDHHKRVYDPFVVLLIDEGVSGRGCVHNSGREMTTARNPLVTQKRHRNEQPGLASGLPSGLA